MSNKRRGQDNQNKCAGGHKRSRRRKHLYLVLDDWSNGFSIYKIDADSFDDLPSGVVGHLPEPPVLRLESPVGQVAHAGMFFSTMGTKIFVFMTHCCGLVYDTNTAVLAIGPHAPAKMECGFGITVPTDDMLYALSYRFFDKHQPTSFEVVSWVPTAPDAMQRPTEGWSWKTLPAPPPAFNDRVSSYALHPDGCTIFMTTANQGKMGTYSFNTQHSVWRWHGEWALPFLGEGYFDSELDAWVGLHFSGYICSCQVVSPRSQNTTPKMQLDWLMTKEKLFCKDPERHAGASLTYMGRSKFCLVETVIREGVEDRLALGDHDGCVIHMTMFGLKYNRQGELRTTDHQSTRSFIVPKHQDYFLPVAFWM
uniref:Uncharacterized protein n=1 Tax=Arundo donax TaxID=35708 RepID=A0A0A9TYR5_ARUDO